MQKGKKNNARLNSILFPLQYDRDKFEEQYVDLSFFAAKTESSEGGAWKSERVNAKKEAQKKAKVGVIMIINVTNVWTRC